ncbi:MAG: type IX secretion system outer membrane channel protein PorV [Paludibacteraceae bacterium]
MKKTGFFLIILLLSFVSQAQEYNPIITAVPSLSIAPDSRGGGMGDVGAATSPDINSQFWNPAKYAFMESPAGVAVSYTPWLRKLVSGINLGYLAGYWKFDEYSAVSGSLRYFSMGEIAMTDEFGNFFADAMPNEMAIDAAYSRMLSDKWSAAVAFRYIRSDLNNGTSMLGGEEMNPGNAFAADIATYYNTLIPMATGDSKLAFGLNISNIGSKISYNDGQDNLFIPTNLRLGASYDYPFDDYNKISISADINKLLVPTRPDTISDDYYQIAPITGIFKSFNDAPGGMKEELKEIMWSVGAEYAYNNQFFVRGGYFNENQYKGNRKYFTAGVGFKLNVFQLDASYVISVAQSNPLDQTLRFSIGFDLAGLQELAR